MMASQRAKELRVRNVDMQGVIPPDEWRYQFPPIAGWDKIPFKEQLGKIREEVQEVADCYEEGYTLNSMETELMDVIHAAETALRIMNGCSAPDRFLTNVKTSLVEKNLKRDYYGKAPVDRHYVITVHEAGDDFEAEELLKALRNEDWTVTEDLTITPIDENEAYDLFREVRDRVEREKAEERRERMRSV